MPAQSQRRLKVIVLLLICTAWALSLPFVAKKLAWLGGRNGFCPLRLVVLITIFSCGISLVISTAVVSLKLSRKSGFIVGLILWLLLATWSVISVSQSAVSGGLLKEHCRGFSETVQSHVAVADLYAFFSTVLRNSEDYGPPFRLDPKSPFNRMVSGSRPTVLAIGHSGSTNRSVLVLWPCAGGGFGLIYGDAPPLNDRWSDKSILLADRIWVVTRGE